MKAKDWRSVPPWEPMTTTLPTSPDNCAASNVDKLHHPKTFQSLTIKTEQCRKSFISSYVYVIINYAVTLLLLPLVSPMHTQASPEQLVRLHSKSYRKSRDSQRNTGWTSSDNIWRTWTLLGRSQRTGGRQSKMASTCGTMHPLGYRMN